MTTQLARPAAAPAGQWNTLQILKASRVAIIVLDALLMIAVVVGTHVHYDAMKVVGKDTAPSIIAAQHIKSALADMDADAANELLMAPGAGTSSVKAYEDRRAEAAGALIETARNITYEDSELKAILSLQVQMGTYEQLIQRARDLHRTNSPEAITAYRDATTVMDQTLLPAADALDKANNDMLEKTYLGQSSKSFLARAFILFAGIASLVALFAVQSFLSQRTRRTFNPLLLLATLLTFGITAYSFVAMTGEQHDLKAAKEDAFSSVHILWQARAISYEENSDESRYLLDPPSQSAQDESEILDKSDRLAKLPAGMTLDKLLASERNGDRIPGVSGYLADELNNITFNGEREAAIKTLVAYERYLNIDAGIRRLQRAGQHREAIDLCLGMAEGQSDWAFHQFDRALDDTLRINQTAFESSVDSGLSSVGGLDIKAAIATAVVAILVFAGLAGRIREYE